LTNHIIYLGDVSYQNPQIDGSGVRFEHFGVWC